MLLSKGIAVFQSQLSKLRALNKFFTTCNSLRHDDDVTPDRIYTSGAKNAEEYRQMRKGIVQPEFIVKLSRDYDLTFDGIKRMLGEKAFQKLKLSQNYIAEREQSLGHELAAAHFLTFRGGLVKFHGRSKWYDYDEDGNTDLPGFEDHRYVIEEMKIDDVDIMYNGFYNLRSIKGLKALQISDCEYVDDYCMDFICSEYSETLERLSISNCSNVGSAAMESIVKLLKLKELTLEGMDHVPHLPLICMLLEDCIPGLVIKGINFS